MSHEDKRAKALRMLAMGRSRLQVCHALGVDAGTLSRWVVGEKNRRVRESSERAPRLPDTSEEE